MTAPTARTARTVAQAKVNLFLRVLAREDNGYHQLETLFCRLELGDDIAIRVGGRGRSLDVTSDSVDTSSIGPVERNLAWRAAGAFYAATGWPNDWAITIHKRIPVGGGLGGGSADAGAVLRCLNALTAAPLDTPDLLRLAARLGADVPFVSIDAPRALAWGRGNRLLPLASLPQREVALACFPFGVATPDAFRWLDESRAESSGATLIELDHLSSWGSLTLPAHNDFEAAVAARFPLIEQTLSSWRAADPAAITQLSGSGSTVYQVADRIEPEVERVVDPAIRVIRTRTASRVVGVELSD